MSIVFYGGVLSWILLFLTKGLLHAFCHSWMVFFRRGLVVDDNQGWVILNWFPSNSIKKNYPTHGFNPTHPRSMWVGLNPYNGLSWLVFFITHHGELGQKIFSIRPNSIHAHLYLRTMIAIKIKVKNNLSLSNLTKKARTF